MTDVPVAIAGAITVALIVVLGIFVYPALLRRAKGRVAIAAMTAFLVPTFFLFDHGSGLSGALRTVVAVVLGLAPLLAGGIVYRLQRGKDS
jgi:hypothetical protein